MYESIRGILKEKAPATAVIECGGIGYRLQIPLSSYLKLGENGSEVFLYLSQVIREDAHTLYAFLTKEERNLFEMLLSISGIGPKTAAGIIGHMEIGALKTAVVTADIRLLSKIPGIGKKTAERLIIEMRDKFKNKKPISSPTQTVRSVAYDATSALINLGYNFLTAEKAVQQVLNEQKNLDLGQLITAALRNV